MVPILPQEWQDEERSVDSDDSDYKDNLKVGAHVVRKALKTQFLSLCDEYQRYVNDEEPTFLPKKDPNYVSLTYDLFNWQGPFCYNCLDDLLVYYEDHWLDWYPRKYADEKGEITFMPNSFSFDSMRVHFGASVTNKPRETKARQRPKANSGNTHEFDPNKDKHPALSHGELVNEAGISIH